MNDLPPALFDKRSLLVSGLLVVLVALVFWQTSKYDFVNFDDDRYVYDADHIKSGVTVENICYYAFLHWHSYTYHPVTTFSHMLDCQLFQLDAGKHHLMNVLIHMATVVGLFLVLRQMTGRLWPSAMVAAVFAIHPLRVESVAWISERKDVLSGLFFVLMLGAYVRYVREPQAAPRYILLCVLFALGLLAKPMLVTVPAVLLLLDYWPLGRWRSLECDGLPPLSETAEHVTDDDMPVMQGYSESSFFEREEGMALTSLSRLADTTNSDAVEVMNAMKSDGEPSHSKETEPPAKWHIPWHLFVEKVPLMLISLFACGITVHTQGRGGAIQSLETVSWVARIANALVSYANYLGLFFWPHDLAVLYPHPMNALSARDAVGKAWLLAIVSAAVLLSWRRMPYLVVGWLWYVGMLVPVIGLMQVGGQSMADRYTYLPQIGLAIALVWTVTSAADWISSREITSLSDDGQIHTTNAGLRSATSAVLAVASVLVVAALAAAAWKQTTYWRNSETLWARDMLYPNSVACYDFGLTLAQQGRHREAVERYQQGLALDPNDVDMHDNLGLSYEALDDPAAAMEQYRAVLAKDSTAVEANNNLSRLLRDRGDDREALHLLQTAYDAEKFNCGTCCRLGDLLATSPDDSLRNGAEAMRLARRSVELSASKDAGALNSRAAAYAEQKDFPAAIKDAEAALKIATTDKDKKLIADIQQRLEFYRAGKPFRFQATAKPAAKVEPQAKNAEKQLNHKEHKEHEVIKSEENQ